MGSVRLPGKSLTPVYGDFSLLEMVIRRVLHSKRAFLTVLATSVSSNCDPLERLAKDIGCDFIRGDESDVMSRYALCCEKYKPDYFVRVCADNPFVSPVEIDKLIALMEERKLDYAANNAYECGLPDGFGADIFNAETFMKVAALAKEKAHREHIDEYIADHKEDFKTALLMADEDLRFPEIKLDIDTPEDLKKIRGVCKYLPREGAPYWSTSDIINAYRRFCQDE
jgi:spore coat polysaccharide biosynthesis protein SpsF